MSFDLLPKFLSVITNPGERQLNEPGLNAVDNCGPACGSVLMQVLGYPDIEPQTWTDYEYWPTYRGGETYLALNDFIASHYSNPPMMAVEFATDQLAAIDGWGGAGLLVMGLFWSNASAQFQSYPTGIGHFALILGYDGSTVTVWNPEWGVQTMSLALFSGSSQNSFDVCHRSILGPANATAGAEVRTPQEEPMNYATNPSSCLAVIRTQFLIAQPDIAPNEPLIESWASKILDEGANGPDAVVQRLWQQEPTFAAYRNRLTAALNAKPIAGPKGDPGSPAPAVDLSKLSPKGHTHLVEPDV